MPKRILVIDDDLLLLEMYKDKLETDGFQVVTAPNAPEGLKKAKSAKPNLILLDILMPTMDGFQALERLKADPETKEIPVVFLTNLSREEWSLSKSSKLGAIAYLVKSSLRPAEVVQKIREVLGLTSKERKSYSERSEEQGS